VCTATGDIVLFITLLAKLYIFHVNLYSSSRTIRGPVSVHCTSSGEIGSHIDIPEYPRVYVMTLLMLSVNIDEIESILLLLVEIENRGYVV
jgi:hypothetical protein